MRCIIPCCGYGSRMGMKPNESKEMLPDNIYGYSHIIDYAFEQCQRFNLEPLVIVRPDKKDLIEYCKKRQVYYMIYEPQSGEEWNDTVLASQEFWQKDNLLMLPDTRFNSIFRIEDMQKGLELGNNAVMALHEVKDPEKWGCVSQYKLFEKCKLISDKFYAWGLIAFKNTYGQELFSNVEYIELRNVGFVYLNSFKDITRNGK